jgi:hypothetical protein
MQVALFLLVSCLAYSLTLKMEAINSSKMPDLQTVSCYNLEDSTLDTTMFLLLLDSQCKKLHEVYHKENWLNIMFDRSQVEMEDTE